MATVTQEFYLNSVHSMTHCLQNVTQRP